MSEKETQISAEAEAEKKAKEQEDNLKETDPMKALENFNAVNEAAREQAKSSPEKSTEKVGKESESEETKAKPEADEKNKAKVKAETLDEGWLIQDKFKDDEKGRADMAKSYKEMQSLLDKNKKAITDQEEAIKPLLALDELLRADPKYAKALIAVDKEQKSKELQPPPKPDDYDILDEAEEGTSSAKWRKEHDEYLIAKGKLNADAAVQKLARQLSDEKEAKARIKTLKKMEMSDQDIIDFDAFMENPENDTLENLVKIWRFLTGKKVGDEPSNGKSEQEKLLEDAEKKEKHISAAVKPGSEEVIPTEKDEITEKVASNLMAISH